jgi:cytochrome c5
MCQGTGKVEMLEYTDGNPVYHTTNSEANKAIDNEMKTRGTRTVQISCQTCEGSGITPTRLEPAYWQGRLDETNEQLDHAFFGLGKYIRKAMEK